MSEKFAATILSSSSLSYRTLIPNIPEMLEIIIQKIIFKSQLRDWGQHENTATCYRTKKKLFHSNFAITTGPYAALTGRDPLDKSDTQTGLHLNVLHSQKH